MVASRWRSRSSRTVWAVGALWLLATPASVDSRRVVLGVLEQPPQCKEEVPLAVRVLFVKQGGEWLALNEPSRALEQSNQVWTIAFYGRALGAIRTTDQGFRSDYAWTYARDRLLLVPRDQRIPSVVNRDGRFEGWCGAPGNRPLVVVSVPNSRDP